MKLDDFRRSDNVEDGRGGAGGGGGGGFSVGHGIGIGGVLVLVVGYFMGVDPSTLLALLNGGGGAVGPQVEQSAAPPDPKDPQVDFVRAVLADTEQVWEAYFQRMGRQYRPPHLVLFSGRVSSAC